MEFAELDPTQGTVEQCVPRMLEGYVDDPDVRAKIGGDVRKTIDDQKLEPLTALREEVKTLRGEMITEFRELRHQLDKMGRN